MKKKGSVLILSILMLSFFMTITLTMYYIARNRNQRSMHKMKGMRIDSGLDKGSVIAHYELYLADEYVSRGHPYTGSGVDAYRGNDYPSTPPTSTRQYMAEITSGGVITIIPTLGKHYTGVVLKNYNEYFGAKWDPTVINELTEVDPNSSITDPSILSQPWIGEEKVVQGKIVSRAWLNNKGEKIVRLWTEDIGKAISVGGYRLIKLDGKDSSGNPLEVPLTLAKLNTTTSTSVILTYEKIVSFNKSTIEESGNEDYRITYIESVEVTPSGSSIIVNSDKLKEMIVEKLE